MLSFAPQPDFEALLKRAAEQVRTAKHRTSPRAWTFAGRALEAAIRRAPSIRKAPRHFIRRWDSEGQEYLGVSENGLLISDFGPPCEVVRMDWSNGKDIVCLADFLVTHPKTGPKAEFLRAEDEGMLLPSFVDPPVLLDGTLLQAGMGTMDGTMRLSPIFRVWHRSKGRWVPAQTVGKDYLGGNGYWGLLHGKMNPRHFVREIPVSSAITIDSSPNADRRIRIEHWIFRNGKYRLVNAHWWSTAFFAAEEFLLALSRNDRHSMRRLASAKVIRQARILGLQHLDRIDRFQWMSSRAVDISLRQRDDSPPVRLELQRRDGEWQVVRLLPRCTAPDTWWSWTFRSELAAKRGRQEPRDPRTRPFWANEKTVPR